MTTLSWCDAGLHSATWHQAMDHHAFRCARHGAASLRFHRYWPTASIGTHDDPAIAVRANYCERHLIPIIRRLTGGEVTYLDPGTLCFSLAFRIPGMWRKKDLRWLMARLAGAVAASLHTVGIDASFREPNEIELSERRLGAVFIAAEGHAVLCQGYLLTRIDIETLLKVVRAPLEKLSPEGVQNARERFITLDDYHPELSVRRLKNAISAGVARTLGARLGAPDLAPSRVKPRLGGKCHTPSPGTFRATLPTSNAVLRVSLEMDDAGTITAASFSGTLQCRPRALLVRAAQALIGASLAEAGERTRQMTAGIGPELVGAEEADLERVVRLAAARQGQMERFHLDSEQSNTLMVHVPANAYNAEDIVRAARVILIPYCAKPLWCKWRSREGCAECGGCAVGDAYRLGRERAMRVVTITNYEHLTVTLNAIREEGETSYIGMCCAQFYEKRHRAFTAPGLPALLIDVSGANCYDLGVQDKAYAGRFRAQSTIDTGVLENVLDRCARPRSDQSPLVIGGQNSSEKEIDPGGTEQADHDARCAGSGDVPDTGIPVVPDRVEHVPCMKCDLNVSLECEASTEEQRIRILKRKHQTQQIKCTPTDHRLGDAVGIGVEATVYNAQADGEPRIEDLQADSPPVKLRHTRSVSRRPHRTVQYRGNDERVHGIRNKTERTQQEHTLHGTTSITGRDDCADTDQANRK